MSSVSRSRFSLERPFPERAVITPDVFPDPVQRSHGRLDLHDSVDGRIPGVKRGQTVKRGWLKIALGNGPDVDYTSPNLSESERSARRGQSRKMVEIELDVAESEPIERVSTSLAPGALKLPRFNGIGFEFADEEELFITTPVEQAIAYKGIASIRGDEAVVSGIHFNSSQEMGWILIGNPPEPLSDAA